MTTTTVFTNNRSQAIRLPAEMRLPEGVKRVDVRVRGCERIIVRKRGSGLQSVLVVLQIQLVFAFSNALNCISRPAASSHQEQLPFSASGLSLATSKALNDCGFLGLVRLRSSREAEFTCLQN